MMRRAVERTVRSICVESSDAARGPFNHAATESVDDDVWTNAFEFGRSVEQHRAGIDEAATCSWSGMTGYSSLVAATSSTPAKAPIMPSASSARSAQSRMYGGRR